MNETFPESLTFEGALAELERTVRELEDGHLGLDDALARYEQGVGFLKHCYDQLRRAEQRVLLLTGVDEGGQPFLQPFKHEATALRGSGAPKTDLGPPRRARKKPEELG
jgi:exodeoxyribonuclease VII small subunit